MTRIRAHYDHGRRGCFIISANGHATGSAEACAGISAILYALAGWLKNRTDCTDCYESMRMEPGDALIFFGGGADVEAVMDMTVIGLAQIAEKYPESVKIEIIREKSLI